MKLSLEVSIRNAQYSKQGEHWILFANDMENIAGPYLETLFTINNNTVSIFLSLLGYFENITTEKEVQNYIRR